MRIEVIELVGSRLRACSEHSAYSIFSVLCSGNGYVSGAKRKGVHQGMTRSRYLGFEDV